MRRFGFVSKQNLSIGQTTFTMGGGRSEKKGRFTVEIKPLCGVGPLPPGQKSSGSWLLDDDFDDDYFEDVDEEYESFWDHEPRRKKKRPLRGELVQGGPMHKMVETLLSSKRKK